MQHRFASSLGVLAVFASGCWLSHERPMPTDASVPRDVFADTLIVIDAPDSPDAGLQPIEWLDPGPFDARVGPEARLIGMAYGDFALFHRPLESDVPVFQVVPVHGDWSADDASPAPWAAGGSRLALWSGTRQLIFAVATETEVRWSEWGGDWSDATIAPTLSPGRLPDDLAFPDLYGGITHRTEQLALWTRPIDRGAILQRFVFEPLTVFERPWSSTLDPDRDTRILYDGETPILLGFPLGSPSLALQRSGDAPILIDGCRGRIDAAMGLGAALWIGCASEDATRFYVVRDGEAPVEVWAAAGSDVAPSVLPLRAASGTVLFGYLRDARHVDVVYVGWSGPITGTLEIGEVGDTHLMLAESADPDTYYSPLYALAWTGGDVVRFRIRP